MPVSCGINGNNNIIFNQNYFMMKEILQLISKAANESDMLEARAAARRYSLLSGDTIGTCKIYQAIQNKARKLVNSKPLNPRHN